MAQNSELANESIVLQKKHTTESFSKDLDQKISQKDSKLSANHLKSRPEGPAVQRSSKNIGQSQLAEGGSTSQTKFQPSKAFAQKCLTELQAISNLIKVDYHEEIKRLYTDKDNQQYTDLYIRFGEKFEKSLHKCIVASRAYKFYTALKFFRKEQVETIVVSTIETHKTALGPNDKTELLSPEELIAKQLKERQLKEALERIECFLPEGLLEFGALESFLRRIYVNQDLKEEELELRKKLIDWIKENKPELIKKNSKQTHLSQPDHRESFRTIQPDFDQTTEKADCVNNDNLSTTTSDSALERTLDSKMDQHQGDIEEVSKTASLARTETFQLISKNEVNTVTSSPTPTAAGSQTPDVDNDEARKQLITDSEIFEVYAPTTRTGLKPKKYTTPVGSRLIQKSDKTPDDLSFAADSATPSPNKNNLSRTSTPGKPMGVARKLSSGASAEPSPESKSNDGQARLSKTKTPSKGVTTPKVITRAHPISLERSHSPATNLASRGPKAKNFIAANKRLLSQMEKKVASLSIGGATASSPSQSDQALNSSASGAGNNEPENEVNDPSFAAIEPLTMDNLTAQLDKFTLASCSKLAEALARMFIGEILTDTMILVNNGNKQISAHKCVLAARSAYLNDVILKQKSSLGTIDFTENAPMQPLKIDLGNFSYQAVYFAMMHIYSGIVKVPEDIDPAELSELSLQLHVGTLRQVCIHNLRMNYCHYFHKPCSLCCVGILKALPLAWRYDYTELYSECLQWIGSHFAQIFCLEEFSNLKPQDLIEECYKATLSQLTADNIIPKTVECQKLLKSLPRVKWTESIICLVGRQLEDFCHFVADNYEKILQSESFLALGRTCWECEVLEENLLAAMNHLKPDSGCKVLMQLDKIGCMIERSIGDGSESDEEAGLSSRNVSESFTSLVSKMRKYCERYLLKEAAAVVHCPSWRQMHPSLQKRIKDQALLSTDFDEPTKTLASKPKLPSMARQQAGSRLSPSSSPQPRSPSGIASPPNRSDKDSPSRLKSVNVTYLPTPKNKTASARHVKVLK